MDLSMRISLHKAGGVAATPWYLKGGVALADCVAAYQPKGATSLAASYINLANPGTNNAAAGEAPSFDAATGWTFNGSSQWLATSINAAAGQTIIVRFSDVANNAAADAGTLFGAFHSAGRLFVGVARTANNYAQYGYGNTAGVSVAPGLTSGVLALNSAAGYRNGAAEYTPTGTFTTASPVYIGVIRISGTSYSLLNGKIQAAALYNTILTAPQVAAITTAMAAL